MKKIIFLFLFLLVITGCNDVANDVDNSNINIDDIDNEIDDIDNLFNEDELNNLEDELNLI